MMRASAENTRAVIGGPGAVGATGAEGGGVVGTAISAEVRRAGSPAAADGGAGASVGAR